jgi:diacylglycerol kinase
VRPTKSRGAFRRFVDSFRYAFAGLSAFFVTSQNARVDAVCGGIVVIAGFVFGLDRFEWCLIGLAIGLVLGAEAFNSALESLADAVHPDDHPLIGQAKDLAAGATLLVCLGAAAVGVGVFGPKLLNSFPH